MTSLLARLPRPGRRDSARRDPAGRDPASGGPRTAALVAAAVPVVVTLLGLAGLLLALLVIAALDPTGGLPVGGSLRLAGQLWLLAQGARLTLASGPVVLAPLLLTLGAGWLFTQAGRWVARRYRLGPWQPALLPVAALVVVHLVVTTVLALLVDDPTARVGLPRLLVGALAFAVLSGGLGTAREAGLVDRVLDAVPGPARAVVRGVLAGLLSLLGLCTLVVAIALAADAHGFAALVGSLGGAGAGALGLLALSALLVPNAALAVVGLAAGPGFVVGSGTAVSVGAVTLGAVPALPLLAALPDTQAVPLLAFVAQVIPALAGLTAGIAVGRSMSDDDGGSVLAGLSGVLTGVLLGVVVAGLVAVAGGVLGDGALAHVGAPAVATGLAVGVQCGIAGAVGGLVARWRRRS